MKKLLLASLIVLSSLSVPEFGHAQGCSARANALVSGRPNASVLAVQTQKNANGRTVCVIRILINNNDGSPGRVVTRRVQL